MSLENLVDMANLLDQQAAAATSGHEQNNLQMAANALDLAVAEAVNSEDPFGNAMKTVVVFANLLDLDGFAKTAKLLDNVLTAMGPKLNKIAAENREEAYDFEQHNKDTLVDALIKEVQTIDNNIETYGPADTILATRNSPDHPGVMMLRVSDGVYQDVMSKKVYDFNKGWTDEKGEAHKGGSVANQTPIYNQYLYFPQIFESRHYQSRPR